jgi:hypothetical protein
LAHTNAIARFGRVKQAVPGTMAAIGVVAKHLY